jgi:hypothetical protein
VRGRRGPARGLASAGALCAHNDVLVGAGSALVVALGPPMSNFTAYVPKIHGGRHVWPRRAPVRDRRGPARGLASAGTLCAHNDVLVGAGSALVVALGPLVSNFTAYVPKIHGGRHVWPRRAPVWGRRGPARGLASAGTLCTHNDVLVGAGSALVVALGPLVSNFTACVQEIHGGRDVSLCCAPVRGRRGPERGLASAGALCTHNDVLVGAGSALVVALGPLVSNFTACVQEIHGGRDVSLCCAPVRGRRGPERGLASAGALWAHNDVLVGACSALVVALGPPMSNFTAYVPKIHGGRHVWPRRAPVRGLRGPARGLASAGALWAHNDVLVGACSALVVALGPLVSNFTAYVPKIHGGRNVWPRRAPVRGRRGPARGLASVGTLCTHNDVLVGAGSALVVALGPLVSNFTACVQEIHGGRGVSLCCAPVRGRRGPERGLASAGGTLGSQRRACGGWQCAGRGAGAAGVQFHSVCPKNTRGTQRLASLRTGAGPPWAGTRFGECRDILGSQRRACGG